MRIILGLLIALFACSSSDGSVLFSGTGINPEASATATGSADFTISGSTLTLVLTNTTVPSTEVQGNVLTGVVFNIDGASPVLSFSNTALTPGSRIWTSESASTVAAPLSGSWTDVLGSSPLGEYGVATTGFNGAFNGGSITLGNASPDYGIVAVDTFAGPIGGSQFPFVQDSLTFTFTGLLGITEEQIDGVKLLFGTNGTGVIDVTEPEPAPGETPEPATLVIWSLGVGIVGLVRLGRKKGL